MKKIILLAAMAALAIPATASAHPEVNFRSEAGMFDVNSVNNPNQVGNVRYREESRDGGLSIWMQRLNVSLHDLTTPDGVLVGTDLWSYQSSTDTWRVEAVTGGPLDPSLGRHRSTSLAGDPLTGTITGGQYKTDARWEDEGDNDDGISDLDEDGCGMAVVADENGEAVAASDVMGDSGACPAP